MIGVAKTAPVETKVERIEYDNSLVLYFGIASVVFGFIGMSVGILIAFQLAFPDLNFDLPFTTFGRIRPLHTNAVIFAFVGNAIFMGIYHSLQRVLKARLYSRTLGLIHFWGWQFIILAAAITLPLGYTTSHEYAELEWPIDIAITLVWVVFGINMIGTILNRREKHIYVAVWFYLATWITVAMLHVVNSIELPVGWLKSYYVYSGVQDALVQWWYGHNAVAFFLTTPFLGLMYYYLPKAANRPVYSYKLSILHFWTLIFIYIWAGPHHLLYSSLPDWAQSLGTVFSVMLIAPSWGGMINGLLTLRGAWDKVREDATLKFWVVALTAYGMATFEGPMLSLKNVNALAHFTDWIVAHVHTGALGWNGFIVFAMLYWLVPAMWQTKLYSQKLAHTHFWLGTLGIVLYVIPMYWSGFTQGMMWKQFTEEGMLKYPNFLETVTWLIPLYIMRGVGGLLYLVGFFVMCYNLAMTISQGYFIANEPAEVTVSHDHKSGYWHKVLERYPMAMLVLSFVVVAIGGLVEMIPTFIISQNVPTIASIKPYTALELEGRDLYIREGCVNCHSQMIRPFRSETERYGEYSKAGEYVYEHPFLWGSKRTGPDLMRVGKKYPDSWHYHHMREPVSMSPGSIMPRYPWLLENQMDFSSTATKMRAMQTLGVPYSNEEIKSAQQSIEKQSNGIVENLKKEGIETAPNTEIVALIAYLQRLGTDIKNHKR